MTQEQQKTTHFGYREVPVKEKTGLVREVFESVAGKYDLMNDMMSLGVHRVWKRDFVANSGVRLGHQVLDLAGGTGDIAALLSKRVGKNGHVVLSDINEAMLEVGRQRLEDRGISGNVSYSLANAESLPFGNGEFDAVTIAFGLRNVTDKDAALGEMYRVLRPGGKVVDPGILGSTARTPEKSVRQLFIWHPSRARQTDRRRRGQLPLPGREHPPASPPGRTG